MSRSASKVALITGCDTEDGIGQAVCHELLQRGYYVYATGVALGNMESLKKSKPESVHTMVMDVTKEEEVQNVVAEVGSRDTSLGIKGLLPEGSLADAPPTIHKIHLVATCSQILGKPGISMQLKTRGGGPDALQKPAPSTLSNFASPTPRTVVPSQACVPTPCSHDVSGLQAGGPHRPGGQQRRHPRRRPHCGGRPRLLPPRVRREYTSTPRLKA